MQTFFLVLQVTEGPPHHDEGRVELRYENVYRNYESAHNNIRMLEYMIANESKPTQQIFKHVKDPVFKT